MVAVPALTPVTVPFATVAIVDALDDQSRYGEIPDGPMGVDLPTDKNPVTAGADDRVPDEITEPDDEKSQEPTPEEEASDEPETPV